MRSANILAFVTVGLWVGMLWVGMDLTKGVLTRQILPAVGQIDFYVGVPLAAVAAVVVTALLMNIANRFWIVLHLLCGAALLALLPYLFFYTGGV